jgi:hypothetical protein
VIPTIIPGYDFMEAIDQRSSQSAYRCPAVAEGHPLPAYGAAGTGGVESMDFYNRRPGYCVFVVVRSLEQSPLAPFAPYAELMEQVKAGFGRTMSRLPEIFTVSRQTLYNWLGGETPKPNHQEKIVQLAAAARAFSQLGVKPTSDLLDRVVSNGKSFLQLLADGADGAETASKLVRLAKRSTDSKWKLDAILQGRKTDRPEVSDMGSPSVAEDV